MDKPAIYGRTEGEKRKASRPERSAIARPSEHPLDDHWEEIGRGGTYFVTHEPTAWIRRHVETIQIKSASFGRRRLTIDVQLPLERELALGEVDGGKALFWIPVVSVAKRPTRSNIDLRDEEGAALPLLTKDENASISRAAVAQAVESLLGHPPSPLLSAVLRELIVRDGLEADLAVAITRRALETEEGGATTDAGRAFDGALQSLAGNSWIWLPLVGRPGERRVVKFHYDIEFERDRLRPSRPVVRRFLVRAEETGIAYPFDLVEQGDGNPRSFLRRLVARIANGFGLAAIELAIETPYISGSATYHLQVESPPGVETRGVRLLAKLRPGAVIDRWHRDHGVHLYLVNAKVDLPLPAVVTLRVGRRGFLTLSWLTACVIAGLLWFFDIVGTKALEHPEVGAAALLVVPALLTAVVVRPGEHPVATRLLFGIRLLVALSGLLSVAAAAAITQVKPSAWSKEHAWFIYALGASVVAGWLTSSWVLSWDTTHILAEWARRRWRSRGFYFASCLLLAVLAAAAVTLGWAEPSALEGTQGIYIGVLLFLGALSAFAAATYGRIELPRAATPVAVLAGLVSTQAFVAVAVLVLNLAADRSWRPAWEVLAYGLWACLLAYAIQELIVRWRKPASEAHGGPTTS